MPMLSVSNFLSNGMDQYFVFPQHFQPQAHPGAWPLRLQHGMGENSLSLAAAKSMLKFLVSVVLLFLVNWASKRNRGESIIWV